MFKNLLVGLLLKNRANKKVPKLGKILIDAIAKRKLE
jgi:hypothetical protein